MSKFLTIPQWYDLNGTLCTGYSANVGNANTPVYVKDGNIVAANGIVLLWNDNTTSLEQDKYNAFYNIYSAMFKTQSVPDNYKVKEMAKDVIALPTTGWYYYYDGAAGQQFSIYNLNLFHISTIDFNNDTDMILSRTYDVTYIRPDGSKWAHIWLSVKDIESAELVSLQGANGTAIISVQTELTSTYQYEMACISDPAQASTVINVVKIGSISLA